MKKQFDVDLVYLWVDGNDPAWIARKQAFTGVRKPKDSSLDCKGRYANNDELKYSLRSIEKYAPWVRKIFIVTDNQTPDWIDTTNPKITIVNQNDILPERTNPCFNSVVIEYCLYKIPDLSEHYIYANDDMFLNKQVSPETFFTESGYPIVRLKRKIFFRLRLFWKKLTNKKLSSYRRTIVIAAKLVEAKTGKYYLGEPHHNIDAYCKSSTKKLIEKDLKDDLAETLTHHLRSEKDVQRAAILYYALAKKEGKMRYVRRRESLLIRISTGEYGFSKIQKFNPTFFCLNDDERATNENRILAKNKLEIKFPDKSSFEL